MDGYRKLSEEEHNLCSSQKQSWFERREDNQAMLEFYNWQISKGLPMNFKKQMKKLQEERKQIVEQIYEADLHILSLDDQLTKGVPKKEEQKTEEVKITLTSEEEIGE